MSNEIASMTNIITERLYQMYSNPWNNACDDGKETFDNIIKAIPGFNEYYKASGARSVSTALSRLVGELYARWGQSDEFVQRNTRTCVDAWRSGSTDMIRYFDPESTGESKKEAAKGHVHHAIDVLSALNYRFKCFSTPGCDFAVHIANVTKFLSSIASSGANSASAVIFYPKSLNDIASMYCTYICGTHKEFLDISRRLKRAWYSALKSGNGRAERRFGSTMAIKEHVIYNIINACYRDADGISWDTDILSTSKRPKMAELREAAVGALGEYISTHPSWFADERHYCLIEKAFEWLKEEAPVIGNTGILRLIDSELVEIFSNSEMPYEEKDRKVYALFVALHDIVFEGTADFVTVGKSTVLTEKIFGMKIKGDVESDIANAVALLRYSMMVTIANFYLERNTRPEERELSRGHAVVERINEVFDDLGFVHLHNIRRPNNAVDWCVYQYITNDKIRNCAKNGAEYNAR